MYILVLLLRIGSLEYLEIDFYYKFLHYFVVVDEPTGGN